MSLFTENFKINLTISQMFDEPKVPKPKAPLFCHQSISFHKSANLTLKQSLEECVLGCVKPPFTKEGAHILSESHDGECEGHSPGRNPPLHTDGNGWSRFLRVGKYDWNVPAMCVIVYMLVAYCWMFKLLLKSQQTFLRNIILLVVVDTRGNILNRHCKYI